MGVEGHENFMNSVPFRCGVVVDPAYLSGRDLIEAVKEALAGGVDGIQLRAKGSPARQVFEWARALRQLTHDVGAWLSVNDRVDIALAVGADGVHLGGQSMPIASVKRLAAGIQIGVSCHRVDEVVSAERNGASYALLGPIYWTASKAEWGEPLSLNVLVESRKVSELPVLAIGGITIDRVSEVLQAGASGVAVIHAVLGAEDVNQAARQLRAAVDRAATVSA